MSYLPSMLGKTTLTCPTEPDMDCCEHCTPRACHLCCDLCDPQRTSLMHPFDASLKANHKPKRLKVLTDYALTEADQQLRQALYDWRMKVYDEQWGSEGDFWLGPEILMSDKAINELCNLAHSHALWTASNIANNVCTTKAQLTVFLKHVEDILKIILSIIPTVIHHPMVGILYFDY